MKLSHADKGALADGLSAILGGFESQHLTSEQCATIANAAAALREPLVAPSDAVIESEVRRVAAALGNPVSGVYGKALRGIAHWVRDFSGAKCVEACEDIPFADEHHVSCPNFRRPSAAISLGDKSVAAGASAPDTEAECRDCGAPRNTTKKCLLGLKDIHSWDRDAADQERVARVIASGCDGVDWALPLAQGGLSDFQRDEYRGVARDAIAALSNGKVEYR